MLMTMDPCRHQIGQVPRGEVSQYGRGGTKSKDIGVFHQPTVMREKDLDIEISVRV